MGSGEETRGLLMFIVCGCEQRVPLRVHQDGNRVARPRNSCAPPSHHANDPNSWQPLNFLCLPNSVFSRMSYGWNSTGWSLFKYLVMHLMFFRVFSWVDSSLLFHAK